MSPLPLPPPPVAPEATTPTATAARLSLEDLLPSLVRKVAWSGDSKKGTVRMELGAGALAGATLTVHADEGRVRVHLDAPPGLDAAAWRQRIHERLTQRGLLVDSIEVG
jgi:hypothetical protein